MLQNEGRPLANGGIRVSCETIGNGVPIGEEPRLPNEHVDCHFPDGNERIGCGQGHHPVRRYNLSNLSSSDRCDAATQSHRLVDPFRFKSFVPDSLTGKQHANRRGAHRRLGRGSRDRLQVTIQRIAAHGLSQNPRCRPGSAVDQQSGKMLRHNWPSQRFLQYFPLTVPAAPVVLAEMQAESGSGNDDIRGGRESTLRAGQGSSSNRRGPIVQAPGNCRHKERARQALNDFPKRGFPNAPVAVKKKQIFEIVVTLQQLCMRPPCAEQDEQRPGTRLLPPPKLSGICNFALRPCDGCRG